MRYVDAFNHFFPPELWERMLGADGAARGIGNRMRNVPCVYDLDTRFRVMDRFGDYTQVLSLGMPPIEAMVSPDQAVEFAAIGNDGLARLVDRHPDRFVGFLASLPMTAPEAAAQEAERALGQLGAAGLQIHTNIAGKSLDAPEFRAIFAVAERFDRPVMLHPTRDASRPDYAAEAQSQFEIWWCLGWPYETSAAMARLVFSGILDDFPRLKVLAHHLGGLVPYLEGRIGPGWDQIGARTSDPELKARIRPLKRRPIEYFRDFYADTALFGARPATICGIEFFGVDKVLFASDSPFDPEGGVGSIRDTIAVLESIDMPLRDREAIAFRNAETLFGLAPSEAGAATHRQGGRVGH